MNIPLEIVEAIVEQLEDSSLNSFCLATIHFVHASQARIFRSLQIRVNDSEPSSARRTKDYRPMSPWQAERLFSASPHLAPHVQRLWVDIPAPRRRFDPRVLYIPARPTDCYPPLQAVLPSFTGVRQLLIGASSGIQWAALPQALKDAIQSIMLLPSINELQFSGLSIPAALIGFAAASVPALALAAVVVEDVERPSSPRNQALGKLTLRNISKSMIIFLKTPGVLSVKHLSIMSPVNWDDLHEILQAFAPALTCLSIRINRRFQAGQVPTLPALRVLELESSAEPGPYRLPDMFVSLLIQISSAMPLLEQAVLHLNVSTLPSQGSLLWPNTQAVTDAAWAHRGPLDLGPLRAVSCRLCFVGCAPFDLSEERRELRDQHEAFVQYFDGKLGLAPLDDLRPSKIIELGSGSGAWAIQAATQFPDAQIVAVDRAPMPERVFPANVHFQMADLTKELEFEAESFDIVHARSVMIHVQNPEDVLRRASRLVKPGGLLLMEETDLAFQDSQGADVEFGRKAEGLVKSLNDFSDVQVKKISIPFGGNGPDDALNKLGLGMKQSLMTASGPLSQRYADRGLTPEVAREFNEEQERSDNQSAMDLYVCWARRDMK
ncbi:S-adenosyl-L-methionine-dependent methyltransferase [Mycena sanguinolenta]|uniref:S-adenosyl-L-methionine-dependent methyltransferase n=1 Tax=Mycena sanguinolenta TaxID=230812 RepID=A0A8H7DFE4_9AGAR|nr:S-adenosyl-L-methionine-dependent methyltransferase [Mycena sanguinolenta]